MRAEARKNPVLALAALGWLASVVACVDDHPCDADQVWNGQLCEARATTADAGASDSGDAAGDAGPAFGSRCTDGVTFADCQGEVVNVCLIDPRATDGVGYCSFAGCDQHPVCPAGWLCYDLSTIQAGAPWACLDPAKF